MRRITIEILPHGSREAAAEIAALEIALERLYEVDRGDDRWRARQAASVYAPAWTSHGRIEGDARFPSLFALLAACAAEMAQHVETGTGSEPDAFARNAIERNAIERNDE